MWIFTKIIILVIFKYLISIPVILVMMTIVVITLIGIITFRNSTHIGENGIIAGVLSGLSIPIYNIIYDRIAIALTDMENHKTESDYLNQLTIKTFFFPIC